MCLSFAREGNNYGNGIQKEKSRPRSELFPQRYSSHRIDHNAFRGTGDSQVPLHSSLITVKFSKENRIGEFHISFKG